MKVTVKPCARDHNENFETSKFSHRKRSALRSVPKFVNSKHRPTPDVPMWTIWSSTSLNTLSALQSHQPHLGHWETHIYIRYCVSRLALPTRWCHDLFWPRVNLEVIWGHDSRSLGSPVTTTVRIRVFFSDLNLYKLNLLIKGIIW